MRARDRFGTALRGMRDGWGRSVLLGLVTAFACGFVFLLFSFYQSFRVLVVERMLRDFPANVVEVRETPVAAGPFVAENTEAPLRMDRVAPLAELGPVRKVYYEEMLRVTSVASLMLGPGQVVFESPVYGISPAYVREDLAAPGEFTYTPEADEVPALVSEDLLAVFNASYAGTRGLPQLSAESVRKLPIELTVGRAVFFGHNFAEPAKARVRVIGTSRKVTTVGLNIPLEWVVAWNRRFLGARYKDRLTRVILEADSPEGAEHVAAEAEKLGYLVRTGRDAVRRLIVIERAILAAGTVLGGSVTALAAVSVGALMLLSVNERRQWIGLLRALGAGRGTVYQVVLLESALVTAVSALAGLGAAVAAGGALNGWMLAHLPRFGFLPDRFFLWDPSVGALCWLGVFVFGTLASLPAAGRAVRLSPIEALSR
jgi:hypothetical protein